MRTLFAGRRSGGPKRVPKLRRFCGAVAALLALTVTPSAAAAEPSLCFDFDKKYEASPIKEAPRGTADTQQTGMLPDALTQWATVRGEVPLAIERVLRLLQEQQVVRDPSVVEMTLETRNPGPYLFRQLKRQTAKRFIFTASWQEEWVYALTEGTRSAPNTVVVSYQKFEGTSHMAHYCGSIVLRRTDHGTDVSWYREARITRRSAQAEIDAMKRYLQRLRDAAHPTSAQYHPGDGPSPAARP